MKRKLKKKEKKKERARIRRKLGRIKKDRRGERGMKTKTMKQTGHHLGKSAGH